MSKRWLLAYDISDPKRLQRVHRMVSREAFALQYSLFLYAGTKRQMQTWLDSVIGCMEPRYDDIRLYPLPSHPDWTLYGAKLLERGVDLYGLLDDLAQVAVVDAAARGRG